MILFFKFTFKNSWLENYSVKVWLKSLKKYKILVLLGLSAVCQGKYTQTICWLLADKLFECVWPFCGVGT